MSAGSAGAPLARQLDLRDGMRVWFSEMPENIADEIDEYALELTFVADPGEGIDAAHIFVTRQAQLESPLATLRKQIARDGQVWVSWPADPTANPASDVTEERIREIAVTLGFTETKQIALNASWLALKLVIRRELR